MEGETLGAYRIETEIGAGGMGTVFLATVERETEGSKRGDRVAVKVVHPHLVARPGFLDRFLREGRIGQQIRHPNVVRALEVGSEGDGDEPTNYIVMEYVEGRTLRRLLEDLVTVPEALLREIAAQVAAGLDAIHETGIVHRDLKPENFLITDDDQVRIMDLGVARIVAESIRLTREGHFAGSLYYAAPEQFRHGEIGPASDLYSVGVLLYELASGHNPFQRDNAAGIVSAHLESVPKPLSDQVPGISDFFSVLVATLLAKDPAERFESAARLLEVLRTGEDSDWWGQREKALIRETGHLPRIPVRRETSMYGREAELALLRKAWSRARSGDGSSLLVEGEAGIGKTRLVDSFLQQFAGEDAHVLYGSYPPGGGTGGLSESILT
ncbi:MAG: serine/threonine-protein kinase, partial [Planctomycetota bacterium]